MAKKVKAKADKAAKVKKEEPVLSVEEAAEQYKAILSQLDEVILNIKGDAQKILKGVSKAGRRTRKDWMTLRNLSKEARGVTIALTRKSKEDEE